MSEISQREYFERIIVENNLRRDDLRREDNRLVDDTIAGICRKFEASVESVERARELQAAEYHRRLSDLNHEAARILKAIEITVSRDTWDGFQKEFVELKERVTVELADRTGRGKSLPLILSILSVALSIFIGAVVYLK